MTRPEGFENVKEQIGFCGIWCGSCPAGNGAIVELTKKYEKTVEANRLEKWAPKDFDFNEFMKGLSSIQKISLCNGCKKGGGSSECIIRTCASKKNVSNCSDCDLLVECKNFDQLVRSNPKIKEDLMEIKDSDKSQLIEKWSKELSKKWPHCVLLCGSSVG